MSKLLDSFICLVSRLRDTSDNVSICAAISKDYKPILLSSDEVKKAGLSKQIEYDIRPVFDKHRDDIMNRNFTFLKDEGTLVVLGTDVGSLYMNTLLADNDSVLKNVTSELLFLFHSIMNEEDRLTVETRFKKPKKPKKTQAAIDMQGLMEKNKGTLNNLENGGDPMEMMSDLLKNNSKEFGNIAGGLLSSMGLDPKKMAKKQGKKKVIKA